MVLGPGGLPGEGHGADGQRRLLPGVSLRRVAGRAAAVTLLLVLACAQGAPLLGGAEAPAVGRGDLVRFIAVGDAGKGNIAQYRVGLAMQRHCAARTDDRGPGCDFVAYLGDNFYENGVAGPDDNYWDTRWADPYRELGLPFYAVLGNHDYGAQPFDRDRARAQVEGAAAHPGFVMPAAWYAFDAGPARVIALDTHAVLMGWTDDEQADWAREQLDAAGDRWRIALTHHPFRSNGHHGSAGAYEGSRWIPFASGGRVRNLYEDILCGRVDLVLSGHDHNRQWLAPVCGLTQVISGAGATTIPLETDEHPARFADDDSPGFAWIELDGDRMRAEFVDEWGHVDFSTEATRTRR
ncbi:MAG: hypothetical protein D6798_20515 [Deltaproteobacteria bacterium]|nr:MAG: hypothetical protein D6798_20515 [Deltaproteobacteria bacterium]